MFTNRTCSDGKKQKRTTIPLLKTNLSTVFAIVFPTLSAFPVESTSSHVRFSNTHSPASSFYCCNDRPGLLIVRIRTLKTLTEI